MGKRGNQRKSAIYFDSKDDDSVSSSSISISELMLTLRNEAGQDSSKSLDIYLDKLHERRGSAREEALSSLNEAFTNNLQHEFVKKNFVTLLHQYLNSIKRGSSKEISLASHALGLLALTIGYGDNAHETFEKSVNRLSEALNSGSEMSRISYILDCLAIITFVGGNDPEEIERAMQLIWQFINPKPGSNVVASQLSPAVISTAISALSLVLTTMDSGSLNSKSCKS